MFDLPGTPPFPVFGLDSSFDGYRWLVLWNDRTHLHVVTLGHGAVKLKQYVDVTTVLKAPRRRLDADATVGPSGYEGALWGALAKLNDDSQWVTEQRNSADWADADPTGPPVDHGPGWVSAAVQVEGQERQGVTRSQEGRTAWLVDLAMVAIEVTGPSRLLPERLSLVDVSSNLDRYA